MPGDFEVPETIPRIKDFAFVITIEADGKARLSIQTNEESKALTVDQLARFFDRFSQARERLDLVTIVNVDPSVSYDSFVRFVGPLRRYGGNKIKVETGDGQYIIVPARRDATPDVKSNPRFLLVQIDYNFNVNLNNEPYGKANDLSLLSGALAKIFLARAQNGVFREGTAEVEKSVYLRIPATLTFDKIFRLARILTRVGSDQILFMMDEDDLTPRK